MANRIVGNVIIVDSAMGNSPIFGAGTGNYTGYKVNAVRISSAGLINLTETNTADIVAVADAGLTLLHFSSPQYFGQLKVPTLTGTAWIYLC